MLIKRYIFLQFIDYRMLQPCISTQSAWGCSVM